MPDEMKGWIYNTLKENQFLYITELDFSNSLKEFEECYHILPRQLIHRDFNYGNILFKNGVLTGYIDFDLSQKNARIFDICYFLIGLLVGHEEKKEDFDIWSHIVSQFIGGYEETNPLTKIEKDSMICLMEIIEILFVAYFISIKKEELSRSAASLFYFIKNNEKSIRQTIFN